MSHFFITGATGAIAREIVPRLLARHPGAKLTVLVRGRDGASSAERFRALLRYVRFYRPELDLSSVSAVEGDVTLPRLGLSLFQFGRLAAQTTHVVHGAASIKLDLSLECARRINVLGTAEALRFAGSCPHLERFAHVSTAYIAGRREGRVLEDQLYVGQEFQNAGEASKCEAEAMVHAAARRLPVTVFRPSIVAGDSTGGRIASFSTLYESIRDVACGLIRSLPGDGDVRLDVVTVDFVAEAVSSLIDHPRSAGRTYHVSAGPENTLSAREILARSIRILGGPREPALRFVPAACTRDDGAGARGLARFTAYLAHGKAFDDAHLREDLGAGVAARPRLSECLPALLGFFASTRWGAAMPWEEKTCLAAA